MVHESVPLVFFLKDGVLAVANKQSVYQYVHQICIKWNQHKPTLFVFQALWKVMWRIHITDKNNNILISFQRVPPKKQHQHCLSILHASIFVFISLSLYSAVGCRERSLAVFHDFSWGKDFWAISLLSWGSHLGHIVVSRNRKSKYLKKVFRKLIWFDLMHTI